MASRVLLVFLTLCLDVLGQHEKHFYKLEFERCGEATMDSPSDDVVAELVYFGLSEGTCAEQGYDVSAGCKSIDVPAVGNVTLQLYDSKSRLQRPDGDCAIEVHFCKVSNGRCAEAVIDSAMKDMLAQSEFSEGTCAGKGYTSPAGSEKMNIPYIGESDVHVDVEIYSKPPSRRLFLA